MARSQHEPLVIPTTAGKRLFEDDLRSAARCLERHALDPGIIWPPRVAAVKQAFENILSHRIRRGDKRLEFWKTKYYQSALKNHNLWTPEYDYLDDEDARSVVLMGAEIESLFPQKLYTPAWPPDRSVIRVSETPVEVKFSGVYHQIATNDLHVIEFSPYTTAFDVRNDPVLVLKTQTLQAFWKDRGTVTVHTFAWDGEGRPMYRKIPHPDFKQREIHRVTSLVKAIETGLRWPTNPCPDSKCPWRSTCFPRE